jgi:hypothetical protein
LFKAKYLALGVRRAKELDHEKSLDLREEIEIDVMGMLCPDSDEGKSEKPERGWPRGENA